MNKSLHAALVKICTSGGGPLFHSSYDGVFARKILSTQSIFHRGPNPDYTVGVIDSLPKTGKVLHLTNNGFKECHPRCVGELHRWEGKSFI